MSSLVRIHLPYAPLEHALALRAADVGLDVSAWLRQHPRAGESFRRMHWHCVARGWISAATADRWAIRLLGRTLDELYGPDWDREVADAA